MLGDGQRYRFRKKVVLQKDGDVGRCGDRGVVVEVYFVMIRTCSEVLQRWVMWRGVVDKEVCWWCVRSQLDIRMVHAAMKNGSMVVDKLYIKKRCCTLEDFLFFSLYSFLCIAMQVMTLKQLWSLSCSDSLDMNFENLVLITISHYYSHNHLRPNLPITTRTISNWEFCWIPAEKLRDSLQALEGKVRTKNSTFKMRTNWIR